MIKNNFKKIVSGLLVLVMVIGTMWTGIPVKAATSAPLTLVDGTYDDTDKCYKVNVAFGGVSSLEELGTISDATIKVNGQNKTGSWTDGDGTYYQLSIPYANINSGISTHVTSQYSCYITVPAGTVIGDITTSQDFHVKIYGARMSSADCLMEQVDTLPTGHHLYNWTDNASKKGVLLYLHTINPPSGDGWESNSKAQIYIDGQLKTVTLEGNKNYYFVPVSYVNMGESSVTTYDKLTKTHIVKVPAGTTVGLMTTTEDQYYKVSKNGVEELTPVTANCYSNAWKVDESKYYVWIKPAAGKAVMPIVETEYSRRILYDDTEKSGGILKWHSSSDGYFAWLIPAELESGASAVGDVKEHIIALPAGTYVGNMILTEDIQLYVNGSTIGLASAGTPYTGASDWKASEYYGVLISRGYVNSDHSFTKHYLDLYVDGVLVENAGYCNEAGTKYDFVQILAEKVPFGDHIIRIAKGTKVGKSRLTNDLYYKTTASAIYRVTIKNETTVTFTNDIVNAGENVYGLHLNATSSPIANGTYWPSNFKFAWDSQSEVKEHGGIYLNDVPLTNSDVAIVKYSDGYWYIDLNVGVRGRMTKGDVITVKGSMCVGEEIITFNEISFIRNANGSFTQYDASIADVEDKEVVLDDLYVNVNTQSSYIIPSTPLIDGAGVTVKINGNETTDYALTQTGSYEVERTMENVNLIETVGKNQGNTIYKQNVYLYATGDANLDAQVSSQDLVRAKINEKESGKVLGGVNDLNFDNVVDEKDTKIVLSLLAEKITEAEVVKNDKSIVYGVISDNHYSASHVNLYGKNSPNGRGEKERVNLRKALNYYKSQNAQVIIFNGDISDKGTVTSYENLVKDIKSVYPDAATRPKLIFTGDNHEWYDAWDGDGGHVAICGFEDVQKRFCDELSELRDNSADTNTHYEVNGYHFIGVSSDDMSNGCATYKESTIEWIRTTLEAAVADDETGERPIFFAIHQAPKNTVISSDGEEHFASDELEDILKLYPQLVVITSHTHAPLQDERSIHQENYTTLNTASTSYAGGMGGVANIASSLASEKYLFNQGLLIRSEDNTVDVERCDFWNDEKIKENWVFETSNDASNYTKYTDERANNRKAPEFPENASLTTTWNEDGTVTLTFDAATHDDFVHHYIVKAYQEGSTTPSEYTVTNFFFNGLNALEDTIEFTLNGLDSTAEYKFEVYAVESWGKTGKLEKILETTTNSDGKNGNSVLLDFGSQYANKTVMATMDVWGNAEESYQTGLGFSSAKDEAQSQNQKWINVDKAKLVGEEWREIAVPLELNDKGQIYLAASRTSDKGNRGAFTVKIRNAKVVEEIENYYTYDRAFSGGSWEGSKKAIEFGTEYANKKVYVTLTVCGNANPDMTQKIGLYGYSYANGTYNGQGVKYELTRQQISTYNTWSKVGFVWQLDANGSFMTSAGIHADVYENYTLFIKDIEVQEFEHYTNTSSSGWQGEFITLDFSNDDTVSAYDEITLQMDVYGIISKSGTSRIGIYYTKSSDSDTGYGGAKVYDNQELDKAIRSGQWTTVTIKVKLDANKKVRIAASRTQGDMAYTSSNFELLIRNIVRR